MGGVAEQHHASVAPARQWLALKDCPFVTVRARLQNITHILMEAFVGLAQFPHISPGRPRFTGEPLGRLRDTGDEVNLALRLRRVIDHDVTVTPPPFRTGWANIEPTHQSGGKNRATGDAALVNRFIRPNHNVAYHRMNAVC